MTMRVDILKALVVLAVLATTNVRAQEPTPTPKPRECSTPVYKSKEVDRRVKILKFPAPNFDDREFESYPFSRIILQSIFCGSGEVTDVKVQRGISPALDQEAIRTAKTIKFRPAEKNGEKVAQWMTLEYHLKRY